MRIAGIQFNSSADSLRNVDRAIIFAKHAVKNGAETILFHQLFHAPWFLHEKDRRNFGYALHRESEEILLLRDFAKDSGTNLVCPIFEEDDSGGETRFYNTAMIIDAQGMIIGGYRKTHLPDFPRYFEQYYFSPGDELPVFDLPGLRVGIAICWDNAFPEVHRTLALKGAEVILAPTAAGLRSEERWMIAMSSQAIANNIYIMRVNRVGAEAGLRFYGDTFCANPVGELLYEPTGEDSAVYLVDVDPRVLADARGGFPHFQGRRPELYAPIGEAMKGLPPAPNVTRREQEQIPA